LRGDSSTYVHIYTPLCLHYGSIVVSRSKVNGRRVRAQLPVGTGVNTHNGRRSA